ncbi:hypothetical protein PPN31114_04215 [Pandoraea pneumonica]|uniref:Uncharacterized protein n=1 Tax=Pandoraea pneumonica TaxID=2508299 RepID=A0A5E4Y0Q2_9BURK|nr:hypothetical protein [Pandoraea pneumonica]VVE42206.1 hypothetical protein PPN31114_04215 [Pandoraea pneumonica]
MSEVNGAFEPRTQSFYSGLKSNAPEYPSYRARPFIGMRPSIVIRPPIVIRPSIGRPSWGRPHHTVVTRPAMSPPAAYAPVAPGGYYSQGGESYDSEANREIVAAFCQQISLNLDRVFINAARSLMSLASDSGPLAKIRDSVAQAVQQTVFGHGGDVGTFPENTAEPVGVLPHEPTGVLPLEPAGVFPPEPVAELPPEQVDVSPSEQVDVAPSEPVGVFPSEQVDVAPPEQVGVFPSEQVSELPLDLGEEPMPFDDRAQQFVESMNAFAPSQTGSISTAMHAHPTQATAYSLATPR